MATTLLLICIAATSSSRQGRFPDPGEPLDHGGLRDAAGMAVAARFHDRVHCSPARAAGETVAAMALTASVEPALADIDHGEWSGLSFAGIDPAALATWLADPAGGAPGGESMPLACQRIGRWMDAIVAQDGPVCAITHPMMVRAALAHALGMPFSAALAIDIAPLSRTVLSFNRSWRLQALEPAISNSVSGAGSVLAVRSRTR
ncbi:histidine phosphatase family protein [Novosphingobium sp. BL-8H]|uniref:histidine phosphatase family protein n=1 Tax=Novosphingobium sp. BL-8H TaxID=3127640 RepID=UPI0037578D5B